MENLGHLFFMLLVYLNVKREPVQAAQLKAERSFQP
jgi:hypothetical protein